MTRQSGIDSIKRSSRRYTYLASDKYNEKSLLVIKNCSEYISLNKSLLPIDKFRHVKAKVT